MDAIDAARTIVGDRFPHARAAVLAGSAGAGRATATSDLDIVVVLPGPPAPYRETIRDRGWLVELFVHTEDSIEAWFARERSSGSCTLAHMLATGRPLGGADVEAVAIRARAHLDAGPIRWTAERIEHRRYVLTDAIDDLECVRDADERDAVAGRLLLLSAELHLALAGRWQGTGKWLVRRLRESDPELTERLMAGHRAAVSSGDVSGLVAAADTVLDTCGGRLTEGYVVR